MKAVKVCFLLALAVVASRAAPVENPEDNEIQDSGCTVDGVAYGEGSRVPDGEDPCQVRICVSGEIQTTPLQCIVRDDCPGRAEPGQCCPSYTHCTSLGKFPQGEAEPYPADAPLPAGQPDIVKEDIVAEDPEEDKQTESSHSSSDSDDEEEADESSSESDNEEDEKSDETSEQSSSSESKQSSSESEQSSSSESEQETEVSHEALEASGEQQDSVEEAEDFSGDAVIAIEELTLAADSSFAQFDDSAEAEVEGSASSVPEVNSDAVEQLILENFEIVADAEGSGIAADEASEPLTEGSGFAVDLSDKLQLLQVAADDSAVDLALGEGSGASASEVLLYSVQADDSTVDLLLEEGSGAAASAPLVQIEAVAADESQVLVEGSGAADSAPLVINVEEVVADDSQALAEGSGDVDSAPLVLSVEVDSLSADGLLDVQQTSDSTAEVVVSSGDAADF